MRPPVGPALLVALAVLLLCALPRGAAASKEATGVEGLAAWHGNFVQGAVAMAFTEAGPGPGARPVAVSAPTDGDGRYRLPLPPGRYHLLALKTKTNTWTGKYAPGDLTCYYLGNPITVEPGRLTRVGFNMVRVPAEAPAAAVTGAGGVAGTVTFEEKPLGRAYLYVYKDAAGGFRGMGTAVVPTDDQGRFRVKLAPGRYWLLARKRKEGGMYGPPQKDDFIGYYPGNPVEVRAGAFLSATLETTTRVDLLEEIWFKEGRDAGGWFEGRVLDPQGQPVAGLYVLFYRGSGTSGTPALIGGPTDAAGRFRIRGDGQRYRLLARAMLGGPPEAGEWYGAWRGPAGEEEVEAVSGREVRLTVRPYRAP